MKINYYTKTKDRNIGDYDEIDCRFNRHKVSYNGPDKRIGIKRPKTYHRNYIVIWLAELTPIEWARLLLVSVLLFGIYCWYVTK
jgi:hypothetical protein